MPQIINRSKLPNFYTYEDPSYAEAADSARIDMRLAHGMASGYRWPWRWRSRVTILRPKSTRQNN